jgi:hypothetical protein
MTDQLMFDTWVELLRPLFPPDAEFTFKPRRRSICVGWVQDDELGRPNRSPRSVLIAFTYLAWKTYRGSRSARRARADVNLIALVQAGLAQSGGEQEAAYDFPDGELRVGVASIDIFPPLSGVAELAGQRLSAG